MRKRNLVTLVTVALVIVLGSGMALADTNADLNITGSYNSGITISGDNLSGTYGGGIFTGGYLGGVALPWIYCVDIPDEVGVPGNYPNNTFNNNGTIAGSAINYARNGITGNPSPPGTQEAVTNAIYVAWLLHTFAGGATTYDLQVGLQGAIWNQIYGVTLTGCNDGSGCVTDYTNDLTQLDAAIAAGNLPNYIGNYDWLSPNGSSQSVDQGLVTLVPDGGMTLMLLGGALVGLGTLRRKFRV
jgi:hypothetical protein